MGLDFWTLLKLIFLAVVILIGFLQFLYKAFIRPLQNAEELRRRRQASGQEPAEDPAREIRDFLAEIRGERVKVAPPETTKEPLEKELIWEVVTEEKPREAPKRPKKEPAPPKKS